MALSASTACGGPRFLAGTRKRRKGTCVVVASMEMFSSKDIVVERLLGTYGYMNISSYDSQPDEATMKNLMASFEGLNMRRFGGQEVGQGSVQTRLYSGRVSRGANAGTRVFLKAYPAKSAGGLQADMMAANELNAHAILQDTSMGSLCKHIVVLLGGFETGAGEQWLVFRNDGTHSGADYAMAASVATTKNVAVGAWDFRDSFNREGVIDGRRAFIRNLLTGAFQGLSFMHSRGRLHQSLGPASIVFNVMDERNVRLVVPRLRDLAFAVDISNEVLLGREGSTSVSFVGLSENLWRRASSAGARTIFERKAFGISDDIYAGGLLLAYIVFVSLSQPGSIDAPSLQRLLETTFRLDLNAAREYCMMDDRWTEAVKFLDEDNRAGWELLQAMLNPDYRQRPIADAVLCHRFMT